MGFMAGKKALIVGVSRAIVLSHPASPRRSPAKAREIAFAYQNEKLKSRVDQAL